MTYSSYQAAKTEERREYATRKYVHHDAPRKDVDGGRLSGDWWREWSKTRLPDVCLVVRGCSNRRRYSDSRSVEEVDGMMWLHWMGSARSMFSETPRENKQTNKQTRKARKNGTVQAFWHYRFLKWFQSAWAVDLAKWNSIVFRNLASTRLTRRSGQPV